MQRVIDLGPEHISAYSLQVEEGTALFNWVRDGKVPEPEDEIVAEMYEDTQAMLAAAGFEHYEISNWARNESASQRINEHLHLRRSAAQVQVSATVTADYRSRHNLVYWRNEPYFGFGCGAHSSDAGQRYWNVLRPREYIDAIEATGEAVAERETIDRALEMGETSMLGLRLIGEGIDRARFADRFGVELDDVYGSVIARLIDQGLIEDLPNRIRLTPRGRLLGNRAFAEFLPETKR